MKKYIFKPVISDNFKSVLTQNEIITPVFKKKSSDYKKHVFTARPTVKINVNEVELTIFKGTDSVLATDIAKVVIRYAR